MSEIKSSGHVIVDPELCTAIVDMGHHEFNDIRTFLDAEELVPKRNALFVRFPARRYSEPMLNRDELESRTPLRVVLQQRGYVYHQYNHVADEFTFYRWLNPSMPCGIPRPFTAKLGVTAVLCSKNGRVCMVREKKPDGSVRFKGKWKYISGAVDQSEDILAAAAREAHEEVGLPADSFDTATVLAGYHQAGDNTRPADYMTVLFVRLKGNVEQVGEGRFAYESVQMEHDPHEIEAVDWKPLAMLRQLDSSLLLNPEWNRMVTEDADKRAIRVDTDTKRRRTTLGLWE